MIALLCSLAWRGLILGAIAATVLVAARAE
jgi:hypothetical protein